MTPSDTPPPIATLTETPVGQLLRDDFTGELQSGWTWRDEVPYRWTITDDGWLRILAEDPSMLWAGHQSNFQWREAPAGDYVVTIHLAAEPSSNFQWGAYQLRVVQADLYLRLSSVGRTISGYYSFDSEDWVRVGRVRNYLPSAVIGLGATNSEGGPVNDHLVARFDYILVSAPE